MAFNNEIASTGKDVRLPRVDAISNVSLGDSEMDQAKEPSPTVKENSNLSESKSIPRETYRDEDMQTLQDKGESQSESDLNNSSSQKIELTKQTTDLEANTVSSGEKGDDRPHDPNIVDWEGHEDPKNPMNWPPWKIKLHIFLVSAITFIRYVCPLPPHPPVVAATNAPKLLPSPLGSSILATGIPQILSEFHSTNTELGSLVVSIYLLGFAAGPLLIAPLSELYGRTPLYHVCNAAFAVITVGCAKAPSLNAEIGLRFLQGCAGSAPLAIGGGTITDLIPQERRGKYMGIYALGPTLG